MATADVRFKEHRIRKWATDMRVDGVKMTVHCFSCTPCQIHNKSYASRHSRDKAVELHERGKL